MLRGLGDITQTGECITEAHLDRVRVSTRAMDYPRVPMLDLSLLYEYTWFPQSIITYGSIPYDVR